MLMPFCRPKHLLLLLPLSVIVSLGKADPNPLPVPARAEAKASVAPGQQSAVAASKPSEVRAHPAERNTRVGVAALVLPNVRWNEGQALKRIESYVRRAAALGAKIVVTPETCLDGYVCHQEGLTREKLCTLAEHENGPRVSRLRDVARELDLYLCLFYRAEFVGRPT